MSKFEKGQQVWDSMGQMYYYAGELDGEHLVEKVQLIVYQDSEYGENYEKPEGMGSFIQLKEIHDEAPRFPMTVREKNLVEYYEKTIKEKAAIANKLKGEISELASQKAQLTHQARGNEAKFKQLGKIYHGFECLLAMIEGKDVYCATWSQYGRLKVGRFDEIVDSDKQPRAIYLQRKTGARDWLGCDWTINNYSDGSGSSNERCVIGTSLEQVKERMAALVHRDMDWKLLRDFGEHIELNQICLDKIEDNQNAINESRRREAARNLERAKKQVADLEKQINS